jgi:hypothetical protein
MIVRPSGIIENCAVVASLLLEVVMLAHGMKHRLRDFVVHMRKI